MILKYMNKYGVEVMIENVKALRKGTTLMEYVLENNQVIELENITQFWVGNEDG
jgi:hypothetical protein